MPLYESCRSARARPLVVLTALALGLALARPVQYTASAFDMGVYPVLGTLGNAFLGSLNSALDLGEAQADQGLNYFGAAGESSTGAPCQGDPSRCPYTDPDARRNVSQIIVSRGFRVEEHDVITRDGYILSIQRIVNPLVEPASRARLRPVILQHGLLASSVDWVINSEDVRPKRPRARSTPSAAVSLKERLARHRAQAGRRAAIRRHQANALGARTLSADLAAGRPGREQDSPNALGFYLANEGYDVFLANSRGNIYAQRHVNLTTWQPQFWAFTFDEQIKFDLPATLERVQRLTGHKKVAYVGHSQGTTMMLGLLADSPEYADIFEPIVLLAPVAFVGNCVTPARFFAIYTPIFQNLDMWFGSSNKAVKYLAPFVCGPEVQRKDLCTNLIFLSAGFNEGQLNETRVSAYLSHLPSGTSWKNMAHWGQGVLSGRFAHFDHGVQGNRQRYGTAQAPDYDLARVRSKSLALFTADNDWLSSPRDVARLKASLRVPLYRSLNVSQILPQWNHIDFLYGKDSGRVVNDNIFDILSEFEAR